MSRIAFASSTVSILRASISAVGRTPMMGRRPIQNTFDPSELMKLETRLLIPFTTDEMAITVETPMTIPRIVNPERSLLVRTVSSAIFTDSRVCPVLFTFPLAMQQQDPAWQPCLQDRRQRRCPP